MRCEECGRPMKNAELWQLSGDPNAPASSSMRHLCWDCRVKASGVEQDDAKDAIVREAEEVVRHQQSADL